MTETSWNIMWSYFILLNIDPADIYQSKGICGFWCHFELQKYNCVYLYKMITSLGAKTP